MNTHTNPQSKTERAKKLFISGNITESLAIFKTFKQGFSKDEKRILEIAHECQNGHEGFYRNISIDTDAICNEAEEIIKSKYKL